MASNLGTVFVELSLDDKVYKQKLSETLTSTQTTARGIETSWKALGSKSEALYDAQRKAAENAYTLIKNASSSTAGDIVRAEEAKNAKIKALNEQQFGSHKSLIDSISKNWIAASAVVVGAIYAMKGAFDIVKMGAQAKAVEESFNILAKSVKIAGNSMIATMKRITNETIDDSDLMLKANKLMIEGFSSEQIVQIAEASRLAARVMGTDVSTAYNQIADSVVNLRERGLKTAGFVIDLNTAYENHAKKLGVAKDELSEYGKQMALSQALHEKYIEVAAKMGPLHETETEKIQKMGAAWKNLQERIGQASLSLINFFFTAEGRSKTLQELLGFPTPPALKKPSPPTPSVEIGYGTWESPMISTEDIKKQIRAPTAEELKKIREELEKSALSAAKMRAEAELLSNAGKMPDWREFLDDLPKGYANIDGIIYKLSDLYARTDVENKAAGELAQTMADDMFPSLQKINQLIDQGEKYWIDYNKQLAISKSSIQEMDWESVASGITQLSSDTERAIHQTTVTIQKSVDSMKMTEDFVGGIGQSISDVWATNMSKMITDAESFSDAMNNIWKGMADAFISAIMKMIVNWILFGNITGQKSAGGGYGGIIGGVVSIIDLLGEGGELGGSFIPFRQFDVGGIADRPTLGIIAERGQPEAVVPLKGGAIPVQFTGEKNQQGNQNLTAYYIYALDPLSFRDFIRKNPESIIEMIGKDPRGAGSMRGTIKGVG